MSHVCASWTVRAATVAGMIGAALLWGGPKSFVYAEESTAPAQAGAALPPPPADEPVTPTGNMRQL